MVMKRTAGTACPQLALTLRAASSLCRPADTKEFQTITPLHACQSFSDEPSSDSAASLKRRHGRESTSYPPKHLSSILRLSYLVYRTPWGEGDSNAFNAFQKPAQGETTLLRSIEHFTNALSRIIWAHFHWVPTSIAIAAEARAQTASAYSHEFDRGPDG
jgi:hypothetical protein